jgi:hypothetical protein
VCRVWARAAMPSGTVQAREKAGKIADSHCSFPFALLLLLSPSACFNSAYASFFGRHAAPPPVAQLACSLCSSLLAAAVFAQAGERSRTS